VFHYEIVDSTTMVPVGSLDSQRNYAKGDTLGGTGVVYMVERAGVEGPVADKRRKLEVSVTNDLPFEETIQPLGAIPT
jgi:hypothetical protein